MNVLDGSYLLCGTILSSHLSEEDILYMWPTCENLLKLDVTKQFFDMVDFFVVVLVLLKSKELFK